MDNIALLVIEDNLAQSDLIQALLAENHRFQFTITLAQRLAQAKDLLQNQSFDLILLDLGLPDSQGGLSSLLSLLALELPIPIIVLTSLDDATLAVEAVRQGAQDYLVNGRFERDLLVRAINYGIERHRIQRELQLQIEREKLMGRILERIRCSLKLEVILQTTVEEVRQFLKADRVLIYRCKNQGRGEILTESSFPGYPLEQAQELSDSLLKIFATQSAATVFPSPQSPDPLWDDLLRSLVNSVLTVPIWQNKSPRQTRLWGQLIACYRQDRGEWHDWEMKFLSHLADQVAIAIRQSELYEQVKQQAAIDGLTGIANRRAFNQKLAQEWRRARREQSPLSLILCDIDYFKQYNDTYGHPQGDRCLKKVAHVLKKAVKRPADLVARYGGEEFALILPRTDPEGADSLAEMMRRQLNSLRLPHARSTVSPYVTLSIGITTQTPRKEEKSYFQFLNTADQALLAAKNLGRDRICTR